MPLTICLPTRQPVVLAEICLTPIDTDRFRDFVGRPDAGALLLFEGVVRNHGGDDRLVAALEYHGHPSADRILDSIAHDIVERHPTIGSIALAHRLGRLAIGDTALLCAVSAAHRESAFHACCDAVETVKRALPVWKRQEFVDGRHEWVNSS